MREQIETALLAANGSRAGVNVGAQSRAVRQYMIDSGLITERGNLTESGARARAGLLERRLDEAFG